MSVNVPEATAEGRTERNDRVITEWRIMRVAGDSWRLIFLFSLSPFFLTLPDYYGCRVLLSIELGNTHTQKESCRTNSCSGPSLPSALYILSSYDTTILLFIDGEPNRFWTTPSLGLRSANISSQFMWPYFSFLIFVSPRCLLQNMKEMSLWSAADVVHSEERDAVDDCVAFFDWTAARPAHKLASQKRRNHFV